MSEEKPVFKVTDRRLFNADGSPREIEREETPPPAVVPETTSAPHAETADAAAVLSGAATADASGGAGTQEAAAASTRAAATGASAAAPPADQPSDEPLEEDYIGAEMPGADDPASFINFLMSIASNAASALGMMEHPVTGQRGVDLELAKHWIDVLGMLQHKTQGNLVAQEKQIFEGLLADLRMQYVALTTAPRPTSPRGFTGRDILGGK
ncbi:MAG TPA: DUF1844 domain-containing protein [Pyrinomonadaceae bacterium]|jgi:hypothetical protein